MAKMASLDAELRDVVCAHANLNWLECDECEDRHSFPMCADCGEDPGEVAGK